MTKNEQQITLADTKLDARQVDDLFAAAAECGHPNEQSQRYTIDLSEQQFISPAGLTGIALVARALRDRGWSPVVQFPHTDTVASYLCWMKLPEALSGIAMCCDAVGPASTGESDALLELTRVEQGTDVVALRSLVVERIETILRGQLGYEASEVRSFGSIISELAQNIIDHSGTAGYVAAQSYQTQSGKFIYISVADDGIGLRTSLASRFSRASDWDDTELIINALKPEFSRHQGRGLGLTLVKKTCLDHDGTLQIRTGTTRLYLRKGRSRSVIGAPFPGTQVAISFKA